MEQAVRSAASPANIACREIENIERFGTYTRLYYEDPCFTNLQELEQAAKLARVLYYYGVRRGDRVVVMLSNSPELVAAFQAIWTLGAVLIPVIPQWTAGEVEQILRSARPSFALSGGAPAARLDEANAEVKTLKSLMVFGESEVTGGAQHFSRARRCSGDREPHRLRFLRYGSAALHVWNYRNAQRCHADARESGRCVR
jgi:acyl-coenzyme A synthetase/AMP-(fatty) acid ligase